MFIVDMKHVSCFYTVMQDYYNSGQYDKNDLINGWIKPKLYTILSE